MSAPVAVSATAGSANLLFTSSILNPSLAVAPVGMWAKASISPPSELAREAGEAQPVGESDRPGGTSLLQTRRWREPDSNPRSPVRETDLARSPVVAPVRP